IVTDMLELYKILPNIRSSNEAIRRTYISCVLYKVALCFDGSIKVIPEYQLKGSHGKGPVDWAIMIGSKIIVITEAKKKDLDHGIAQNTIQLHTAIQENSRKGFSNGDNSTTIYGIVTTGSEWIIIKFIKVDPDQPPIKIFRSSLTPICLPLTEGKLDKSKLQKAVEDLFAQILW
ncbi:7830_t:CDS:1, partial [Paraglomus occultum]